MTTHTGSSQTISFDRSFLGAQQPREIVWERLIYTGEVIVGDALADGDFDELTGDTGFRIILASRSLRPRVRPRDMRTALVVPRFRFDPMEEMHRASVGEANAASIDGRDGQLRRLVQMQQTGEWRGARRRVSRGYAEGRIYAHETVTLSAAEIFAGDSLERSVDELALSLLGVAFPHRPIDSTDFPATLDAAAIETLYAGLFHRDPTAKETVKGFGPGLGVTVRSAARFDASNCAVHDIIDAELADRGGAIPSAELIATLIHAHGLNRPLALFYLLSFVMRAHAEVTLADGHDVRTPAGGRFQGASVTWDLLSEVEFSESLFTALGMLSLEPSPTWNTVIPYLTALTTALETEGTGAGQVLCEYDLPQRMASLNREVVQTRRELTGFGEAFPASTEVAGEVLENLTLLSSAADYTEFHTTARDLFGSPSGLAEALGSFNRARRLAQLVGEITRAKAYLESMSFGQHHQGLALERASVTARIDPGSLHTNPSLWTALEVSIRRLKERYAGVYRAHHGQYHRGAASLRTELEARGARVAALARFNEITDLGAPVGAQVQSAYRDLLDTLRRCDADDNVVLESAAYCQECGLPLAEDVPTQAADELFVRMDTAMREYNRRLSSQAVRQVLANQSKEQLDTFIDLLHVADTSALEQVLDDEVIEFLRQFVR